MALALLGLRLTLCAATRHVQEPPVLPLTGATFASALTDHPLLFVLFYSAERIQGTHLLTNYSLAADELRQAHNLVKVKLAWLEVRWDDAERVAISRRYGPARVDTLSHTAPQQHPVGCRGRAARTGYARTGLLRAVRARGDGAPTVRSPYARRARARTGLEHVRTYRVPCRPQE